MRNVFRIALLIVTAAVGTQGWAQGARPAQGPAPSLSITIRARLEIIKVGSPCFIELTIKNISNHEISFSSIRGELPFEIDTKDEGGIARPESELQREKKQKRSADPIGEFTVYQAWLKPGESDRHTVDLNDYYDMTKPGSYTVKVRRPDPESQAETKSNVIAVTVTP
jgi:hypothetical protein